MRNPQNDTYPGCYRCIWRRVLVETEATAVTLPGWMTYQRRL